MSSDDELALCLPTYRNSRQVGWSHRKPVHTSLNHMSETDLNYSNRGEPTCLELNITADGCRLEWLLRP